MSFVCSPGTLVLSALDSDGLTPEENATVREGLDELEAEKGTPLKEIVQEFESGFRGS